VFFAALLLGAFLQPQGLRSLLLDGDTGWHIRTGELILRTGHTPVVDPFSFSRAGEPWFAWEWLADVLFAWLWQWRGLGAVAATAGVVLAAAGAALLTRMLRSGCGLWIALASTMAAASASSIHYLARPHVFSILFYTLALWMLHEDRGGPGWRLWLLAPLTALWVNLHAGFVAWLATLGVLLLVCAWQRDWSGLRRYGSLAALCSLASLLNPYGWRLHMHIAAYLNSSWIADYVQEFQSPQIRSEGMTVFALLLLVSVALASRAAPWDAVLVMLWGFAALRSARFVPFFAVVAAPVLAGAAADSWKRMAERQSDRGPSRIFRDLAQELGARPRATLWLPLTAVLAIAAAPAANFPDSIFPVQAVERNLHELAPGGSMPRILTSDQWADYLTFRLYPRQRIFFDGRSDFFGASIGSDYRRLMAGSGSWRKLVREYRFDMALLPLDWSLSTVLDGEPGWQRVYRDSVAVLYRRQAGPARTAGVPEGGF
jgi:hypothetical protein